MILTKILGPWGCSGTRVMTIFVSHFATHRADSYWWCFFLTWPYRHLQGWYLVCYYWISHEKSNDGYTSSEGWTFFWICWFSIIHIISWKQIPLPHTSSFLLWWPPCLNLCFQVLKKQPICCLERRKLLIDDRLVVWFLPIPLTYCEFLVMEFS